MLKSSVVAFSMRVVGTALWLAFTVVVARSVSVDDFGAVFLVLTFAVLGGQAVLLGYNVVALRLASAYWAAGDRRSFSALIWEARRAIAYGTGLLAVGIVIYARVGSPTAVTSDAARMGLGLTLSALTAVMIIHMEALRATENLVKALFGTSLFRGLGSLAMIMPFAIAGGLSVDRVLALHVLVLGLAALLEVYWIRRLGDPAPQGSWRLPHLKQALGVWPAEMAMVMMRRSTTLVLGLQNDLGSVAMFVAAERVATLSDFVTDALRVAMGPKIAIAAQAGGEALAQVARVASALMFVVGFVGGLGVAVLGWLILAAFGPQYTEAFGFLLALVAAHMSWPVFGPTGLVANMAGLGAARSRISGYLTLLMIVGQLIMLPLVGPWGVVAVVVVATWGINFGLWLLIYRRTGIQLGLPGLRRHDILDALRHEVTELVKR